MGLWFRRGANSTFPYAPHYRRQRRYVVHDVRQRLFDGLTQVRRMSRVFIRRNSWGKRLRSPLARPWVAKAKLD